jgi:hypothetical protein
MSDPRTLKRTRLLERLRGEGEVGLAAKGAYVARAHQLEQLAEGLARAGLNALLVKGAALALTHYPEPWERPMGDIDLMSRPDELERVVRALEKMGYRRQRAEGRRWSRVALAEEQLLPGPGMIGGLVEVHPGLDKVAPRRIPYDAVFARAAPAPGLAPLLVPANEDHALMVALHASLHEFQHELGFVDFDRMVSVGLDWGTLKDRAEAWKLRTVMYVMLTILEALGVASIDEALTLAFEPSRSRRAGVRRVYRMDDYPAMVGESSLGLGWVVRQAVLRDDLGHWCRGIAWYAALRAIERGQAALGDARE